MSLDLDPSYILFLPMNLKFSDAKIFRVIDTRKKINSQKNDYKKREKSLIEEKQNKEFIEKYNIIKAEQWPKIHNKTEFYALSEEIKRECREVFNFPYPMITDFIS